MPKRTDISSILVIGASLTLVACGGQEVSRSETTELAEPTTEVSECIAKFSRGKALWSAKPVRASFVYDASDYDDEPMSFFENVTDSGAPDTVVAVTGHSQNAVNDFLATSGETETAVLMAEETILFRVTSGPDEFDALLEQGCGRLSEGVAIKQVTFSRDQS